MSFVHLHLMASHIPVIGILILVPVLAIALARRSDELAKISFLGLAGLAIAAVAVYLTGEPTEEGLESVAGISKAMIEQHEEVALISTVLLGVAGALALIALFRSRKTAMPRVIVVAALVTALGLSGVFGFTANLGGKIRHSEIASSNTLPGGESQSDRGHDGDGD
jgi:hypothetical protein